MSGRRMLIALAAAAGLVLVVAPAGALDEQPMNELQIGSSQRSVMATAGAGCIREGDRHTCSGDARSLPLEGTLFVRPGHRIALDFDWPVEHIHVSPYREPDPPCAGCFRGQPTSLLELSPVGGKPARRWEGTVPATLERGFMHWSISVQYDAAANPSGNRNFQAGVWVLRSQRRRVIVPRLTGRSYAAATRELERRGLRWRRNLGDPQFDTGPPPAPGRTSDVPAGRVVAQSRKPGTRVDRGGTIRLTVES